MELLNQSVAIYVSALGENHPNVVSCYEQIGDISHDLKERVFISIPATMMK